MSSVRRVLALIALTAPFDFCYAAAALSCPSTAPLTWQLGPGPLVDVQVISYPAGDKVDYSHTLPLMVPDEQKDSGGVFYQTWFMNTDAPKFTFEFVCVYKNIDRKLPVPAPGVTRCVLSSSPKKAVKFRCF